MKNNSPEEAAICVATASLILGIAGAGASAFGSYETGAFQGQVARNNAIIAQQNADYARQAGSEQASIASRKGAAEGGKIKAAQAANGLDVNSGSALDVQAGERETNRLDAETVLNNAELTAYGYTTQSNNFKAQAQQDETAGDIGAVSSLLDKASSLGPKWSQSDTFGG
jgi:hypothetical protein